MIRAVEVANAFWKKTAAREISPREADVEREDAAFVTADQRLLRRLSMRKLDVSIVDLRTL